MNDRVMGGIARSIDLPEAELPTATNTPRPGDTPEQIAARARCRSDPVAALLGSSSRFSPPEAPMTDAQTITGWGAAPPDIVDEIAAAIMELPWARGGTDDEHSDRHGDVQNVVEAALTTSPAAAMREALEFYANEWLLNSTGIHEEPGLSQSWMEPTEALLDDAGQRARTALTALPLPSPEPAGAEAVGDHKWTLVRQDFLDQLIEARDRASSAEAEIERLRADNKYWQDEAFAKTEMSDEHQARAAQLAADLAEALRLLEPFAKLVDDSFFESFGDDVQMSVIKASHSAPPDFLARDLRAAAAFYNKHRSA